jgi:hypothetical protein
LDEIVSEMDHQNKFIENITYNEGNHDFKFYDR